METQMKCYEVMTVSTGLCGSENCVLTDKNSSSEMRFLRSVSEVTRQDSLTNEAVKENIKGE
jgi:hypothetical protein